MKKLFLPALLALLLSGCSANDTAPVTTLNITESDYRVFVSKEKELALLEPKEGCYLGAYVLSNRLLNYSMQSFDEATEKGHAIAVNIVKLGESFPYEWVLECISNMKTPYIIVEPPNSYIPFQESLLTTFAKEFGELYVPIFVDFYPSPQQITSDNEAYKAFFRKASSEFRKHASNTVIVSSVSSGDVYDYSLFYPGNSFVDWVGINIVEPIFINGERNTSDYIKEFEFFYTMFAEQKPIAVSRFALSSYSTENHTYTSQESAERLGEFYRSLTDTFTRAKLINYMDVNSIENSPANAVRDNFSVTQDQNMLSEYRKVVQLFSFLSETTMENTSKPNSVALLCPYKVYEDENFLYLSEETVIDCLGIIPKALPIEINGGRFYKVQELDCQISDRNVVFN